MKKGKLFGIRKRGKEEAGLTLLEYAAGAAFMLATAAAVMLAMRDGMTQAFDSIGQWLMNTTNSELNGGSGSGNNN